MKHQPPKLNHLADRPTPTILGLPRQVMLLVAGLALASVIIDIGFELPEWTHLALNAFDLLLAICFMVDLALILLHAKDWRLALRQRWYEYALVGIFISALAAVFILSQSDQLEGLLEALHIDSATKLLITLTQIYILGSIFLRILQAQTSEQEES